MKKILYFAVLLMLIFSCGNQKSYAPADESASYTEDIHIDDNQMMEEEPIPAEETETSIPDKKKIIRDGRLGIRVQNLQSSRQRVDSLIRVAKGYYANENLRNSDRQTFYSLTIRIPSKNFEKFISQLESGEGIIQYKEIEARDVTEQFVDLETRLASKRSYLNRYRELVKRANTIREVLTIEEKIRALEEEIESVEGRLRYMTDRIAYSTLELELSTQKTYKYQHTKKVFFGERMKESVSKGWYGFLEVLLFLLKLWPFLLIVVIAVVLITRITNKKRKP